MILEPSKPLPEENWKMTRFKLKNQTWKVEGLKSCAKIIDHRERQGLKGL